jgi:hypothetical protein
MFNPYKDNPLECILYKYYEMNSPMPHNVVTTNLNITMKIIKKYLYLDFLTYGLNRNWHMGRLSSLISLDEIEENLQYHWNWYIISTRQDLTFDFVKRLINKYNQFDFDALSSHRAIPIEYMIEHYYMDWDWNIVSLYKKLSIEIINNNKHISWKWQNILQNDYTDITLIKYFLENNYKDFTNIKTH